jgi:hypothetical protein
MGDFRGGLICLGPLHKGPLVSTIFIFHSIVFVDSLVKNLIEFINVFGLHILGLQFVDCS